MHYPFPLINTIDDVLPALEGHPEFIIAERDGYKVVNYLVSAEESFPEVKTIAFTNGNDKIGYLYESKEDLYAAIRRECRGLIFTSDGEIMSRRYHKFFNIGEREETFPKNIDLNQPHRILIKMDGSMISFIRIKGKIKATTKMGTTDVALLAEEYVNKNKHYYPFIKNCIDNNFTAIFEFCSRKQRIVMDYPEDMLVLTAVRQNVHGTYYDYAALESMGNAWNIPVVEDYPSSDLDMLMEKIKNTTDIEGVVIRFDDGHMLKLKTDQYVLMHKAKDSLVHEKNVVAALLDSSIDDIKSLLSKEDLVQLVDFENKLLHGLDVRCGELIFLVGEWRVGTKKDFALNAKVDPMMRSLVFTLWDSTNLNEDAMEAIASLIKKNCGSQSGIDKVRYLWNNHKWSYNMEEEK